MDTGIFTLEHPLSRTPIWAVPTVVFSFPQPEYIRAETINFLLIKHEPTSEKWQILGL